MVTIKDGCGCGPYDCDWKQKLKEAYSRATVSVNKIGDNDGSIYYPDGTGFVKLPLPRQSDVSQIQTNTEDIADLKVQDIQLQANITTEETARKAKDELLDADITRIDNTDAGQDQRIQDNADRITSTYNDLVSTEATVATHDSKIITLQAQTEALSKSLISDVMMTDGTTAGSVQVSIEREDGSVVSSTNYRWGRDIGVRLEAGTQAGYIKTVISLSDGTEVVSNEYKIVEVLESDVYVTAITLVPDMTAGTIGGNISYSNGTTQTINTINVPTAPGVTSAIEALQSRMTAVEQKNTTQDSQISAIDARVKAIEDTPGVGQFGAGKLGTIAGSSADGKIAAENDGTGSVNGWNALKSRVSAAEAQIVSAQNDISALDGTVTQQTTDISGLMTDVNNLKTKNTQQDTAIAGKVAIAQGAANAGKALVVGSDGNVSLTTVMEGAKIGYANLSHVITLSPTATWAENTSGTNYILAATEEWQSIGCILNTDNYIDNRIKTIHATKTSDSTLNCWKVSGISSQFSAFAQSFVDKLNEASDSIQEGTVITNLIMHIAGRYNNKLYLNSQATSSFNLSIRKSNGSWIVESVANIKTTAYVCSPSTTKPELVLFAGPNIA